jgi:hypothetical protein
VSEEVREWREALRIAKEKGDVKTMAQLLQNIHENRRGRPFVSTNPDARARSSDDGKIQIAIQNLIGTPKRSSRKDAEDDTRTLTAPPRRRKTKAKTK